MPVTPVIRPFRVEDETAVIALWRACGLVVPWNDPVKDIRRKLAVQAELFLVAEVDGQVVGATMLGYDGHRGWVYYLAVDPARRREGLGRALMEEAEERLRPLGCPKICLQIRHSNREVIAFYRSLGYEDNEVLGYGKCLEVDGPRPVPAPPGPALDAVVLSSRRPAELEAFYDAVLGPLEWERLPGHRSCRLGESWFGIDELAGEEHNVVPVSDASGSTCVRFVVDDLDAAWDRAMAAGTRELIAPETGARGARLALGLDPQGNLFGLRQR